MLENCDPNAKITTSPRRKSLRLVGLEPSYSPSISFLKNGRLSINSDDGYITASESSESTPIKHVVLFSPKSNNILRRMSPRSDIGMNETNKILKLKDEIILLEQTIRKKDILLEETKQVNEKINESLQQSQAVVAMQVEEINSLKFFTSLQDQKIGELEQRITVMTSK